MTESTNGDDLLTAALRDFRDAVGAENVDTRPVELRAAETATYPTSQRVPAIVRPANRAEVQECMRIANRHRVAVHPISTGKNWGYGSRVPATTGSVLLDLGRMNRILAVDEELGTMTVEPGVTFAQAYEYLESRGSRFAINATGGSSQTSLIGNALERGIGFGPAGDRATHVSDLEVVLPSGQCIHTGFGRFDDAKAKGVHRFGLGPHLDGLFVQSNLGVVTKLTTWLVAKPRRLDFIVFTLTSDAQLPAVVEALRLIRMDDRQDVQIQRYVDEVIDRDAPPKRSVPDYAWRGFVAFYSNSNAEASARMNAARELLKRHVTRLVVVDLWFQRMAYVLHHVFGRHVPSVAGIPYPMLAGFRRLTYWSGVPNDYGIALVYQRTGAPIPEAMDLDRDRRGVIWFAPVVRFTGAEAIACFQIIDTICTRHGFTAYVSFRSLHWRTMHVVASIMYDRDENGADDRAMRCYEETTAALQDAGHYPYRLGVQSMLSMPKSSDDHDKLIETLKRALDPNDVLSPGRYDFRNTW